MAVIYSTDESYKRNVKNTQKPYNANTVRFEKYYKNKGGFSPNAGVAIFSIDIARKAFIWNKCVLGYDDEKKEILVIPKSKGNIFISHVGDNRIYEDKVPQKISMKMFLRFIGLKDEDFPEGKYPCEIDKEGIVHIFLDKVKKEDK